MRAIVIVCLVILTLFVLWVLGLFAYLHLFATHRSRRH
jgi:phage shock protein PspC (stress-responsive transcriptional regulator)